MNCGGNNNGAYENDTCGAECREEGFVRFGTGGLLPPPIRACGYSYYALRLGEASSGDILTPEYVSGHRNGENGAPVSRCGTVVFYTFGADTPNGIISASVIPLGEDIPPGAGTAYALRTPSGRLAQTCGAFAVRGGFTPAFRLESLSVARFTNIALDLILIYFP